MRRCYDHLKPLAIYPVCLALLALASQSAAASLKEKMVQPDYAVIDNYAPPLDYANNTYSALDTDRGTMGDGNYSVALGDGAATVEVAKGWAGVWTSLKHTIKEKSSDDVLQPSKPLGSYVISPFQPQITGVKLKIKDGAGQLKVELKNSRGANVLSKSYRLEGGSQTIQFAIKPNASLKELDWLIDGPGHITVQEAGFTLKSPSYSLKEAVFLASYGHFTQTFDPATGLVRDRARWPAAEFAGVPSIGVYALATAVAYDLGYVQQATAKQIVEKAKQAALKLSTYRGLLPHFLKNGDIAPNTEWSSIDTVITFTALIMATDALGIDNNSLKQRLRNIDWNDLTDNGTQAISHGYYYDKSKIPYHWDSFGSESFVMAVAYAAATGNTAIMGNCSHPPTWNGSGFIDEMASLFYPMQGVDAWENDWSDYRQTAFDTQYAFFIGHYYEPLHLYGLSAGEVSEPWKAEPNVYQAFGVGGCGAAANTGEELMGYPVIAPHYAAMIAAEHSSAFVQLFSTLLSDNQLFSPLNNVESFGMDEQGVIAWNPLKGAWNLGLQTLGIGRAVSAKGYLPYRLLRHNDFLYSGFLKVFTPMR